MKVGIKMDKKVPLREKLGYGVGAVGLDLSYGLFYSYLSLYLTNALGISSLFLLILTAFPAAACAMTRGRRCVCCRECATTARWDTDTA